MSEIVVDDFLSGSGTDGSIGQLGWRSATGTVTPGSGSTDHPGIIGMTTGTTSGDACRVVLGRTAAIPVADIGQVLRWQVSLALASNANILVRVGWGTDISSSTMGTDGIWWSWSSASGSTWKFNCRSGGATTTIDSGVSSATSYVTLAAYRQGDDWIGKLLLSDGTETTVTSTTNEPADGTALNFGYHVETLTNAAKTVAVDSFGMRYCRSVPLRKYL